MWRINKYWRKSAVILYGPHSFTISDLCSFRTLNSYWCPTVSRVEWKITFLLFPCFGNYVVQKLIPVSHRSRLLATDDLIADILICIINLIRKSFMKKNRLNNLILVAVCSFLTGADLAEPVVQMFLTVISQLLTNATMAATYLWVERFFRKSVDVSSVIRRSIIHVAPADNHLPWQIPPSFLRDSEAFVEYFNPTAQLLVIQFRESKWRTNLIIDILEWWFTFPGHLPVMHYPAAWGKTNDLV